MTNPKFPGFELLVEAQDRFRAELKTRAAVSCPCCNRTAKVYKRHITAPMARFLLWLARHSKLNNVEWVHIDEIPQEIFLPARGDYSKLAFWRLIENMPNDRPETKNSGFWKLGPAAVPYLAGEPMPYTAFVLFGDCIGFSDDKTTISDALDEEFDYAALMEYDFAA